MTEVRTSTNPVENPAVEVVYKRPIDLEAYKTDFACPGPAGHEGPHAMVPAAEGGGGTCPQRKRGFRASSLADVSTLYKGNWLFVDDEAQKPVMAYLQIPEDCSPLIPHLLAINWTVSNRPDGTPSRAKLAGWLERNPPRARDFCRLAGLANENPAAHNAVLEYAKVATAHYQRLNPDLFAEHMREARSLLDEYQLAGTPFTTGNVNRDNVLPYHYDAGNIRDKWSLMLGFKRGVGADANGDSGNLVMPEYDLALEIADNTLSGFDGQVALHGVSPFAKLSRDAYRFTIVYYAKVGIWQCLSLEDEVKRGRAARDKKEYARWERDQARGVAAVPGE